MRIRDRLVCEPRTALTMLCTLALIGGVAAPRAHAQEFLRLPDFAEEVVKAAADEGDREALYILASVYFKGKRVPTDYRKSAELLTRAAEQGLALAQLHLGEMYFDGTRIPQNDEYALRWYQVAALQGLALAQYGMGQIYAEGRGITQDFREAARWYEQAAMQGHGLAQRELGLMHAIGSGVPLDLQESYKWLAISATQGVPQAVSGRDQVRNRMTPSELATAQRNAASFTAGPHYNSDELAHQARSILARAKAIQDVKP